MVGPINFKSANFRIAVLKSDTTTYLKGDKVFGKTFSISEGTTKGLSDGWNFLTMTRRCWLCVAELIFLCYLPLVFTFDGF